MRLQRQSAGRKAVTKRNFLFCDRELPYFFCVGMRWGEAWWGNLDVQIEQMGPKKNCIRWHAAADPALGLGGDVAELEVLHRSSHPGLVPVLQPRDLFATFISFSLTLSLSLALSPLSLSRSRTLTEDPGSSHTALLTAAFRETTNLLSAACLPELRSWSSA